MVVVNVVHIFLNGVETNEEPRVFGCYAEMLCRIGGTRLLYQPETKPEGQVFLQTTRLVLSVDKLRGLGWRPMYTLEEGMHDILDEADGK